MTTIPVVNGIPISNELVTRRAFIERYPKANPDHGAVVEVRNGIVYVTSCFTGAQQNESSSPSREQ